MRDPNIDPRYHSPYYGGPRKVPLSWETLLSGLKGGSGRRLQRILSVEEDAQVQSLGLRV